MQNRLYFLTERELLETSVRAAQAHLNDTVRCRAYNGNFIILGQRSATEKLYDEREKSMDEFGE